MLGRVRPEFKAIRIETEYLPNFEEFPKAELRFGWEDNVFRTEENTESDHYMAFLPNLAVRSNWQNYQFEFETNAHL